MGVLAITTAPDAINPTPGDLALSPEGRMFTRDTLADVVDQRLRTKANFRKGEWFLNTEAGLPYFEHILDKPTEQVLRSIFGQMVRNTEGVAELTVMTVALDRRARRATINFEAKLDDGTVYKTTAYAPFVISG
jgi:hypothetical protein